MEEATSSPAPTSFKAETRQLLNILIHSLYTDREIFLRELISNASDALTRINFEMLTNREVLDPDAELMIHITTDPEQGLLTIRDTGIGMTAEEMVENLGTIAHSGARSFMAAAQKDTNHLAEIIGQFGVGFYSVFMVAEWARVTSRSHQREAQAAVWFCSGSDTFTVEPAEMPERGTVVQIKLKEDAKEFAQGYRLRDIIRKHSDFIAYPIYLDDKKELINRQTALWRQPPRKIEKKDYDEFYRQLTLDFNPPLVYTHLAVDAPVQVYAILFIPTSAEHGLFSLRKDDGLKLYARKVMIQEYCKDLLPEYLRFVQGVVDSEDLPLNISRETVQAGRVMLALKKLVTAKALDLLEKLSVDQPEDYARFWGEFGRFIKEGVATEQSEPEKLFPLLRFHTTTRPEEQTSLEVYVARMKPEQTDIYYILGDEGQSLASSPHLDALHRLDYEVLLLTDPLDAFMLMRLQNYNNHPLTNVANAELTLPSLPEEPQPEETESPALRLSQDDWASVIDRFKAHLGDKVTEIRMTDRLSGSPARLVNPKDVPNQELQRVYRLLKRDEQPAKKILELNPRHPIIARFHLMTPDSEIGGLIIDQVYENALLIEGLHPDPASMISRIQKLMEQALK